MPPTAAASWRVLYIWLAAFHCCVYANSCLPSPALLLWPTAGKAIAPIYEQLSQQYPHVKFLKVDIDNESLLQVVQDHGITGVVSRLKPMGLGLRS